MKKKTSQQRKKVSGLNLDVNNAERYEKIQTYYKAKILYHLVKMQKLNQQEGKLQNGIIKKV